MLMSMKKKPKNYDYFLPNKNQMKNFLGVGSYRT